MTNEAAVVSASAKTVTKMVETTVEDATQGITLVLSAAGFRRLGRIILAHHNNEKPYHGPRTDQFSADLVERFGFDEVNTRPQ